MPARRPVPRRKRQNVQRRLLRPSVTRAPGRTREGGESDVLIGQAPDPAEEPEVVLVGSDSER